MANLNELDTSYVDKLGDYFPSVGYRWEQNGKEFVIVKADADIGTALAASTNSAGVTTYSGGANGIPVIFNPETFEAVVGSTGNTTGRVSFSVGVTATAPGSIPLKQIEDGDCFAVQIRGIANVANVNPSAAGATVGFTSTAGQLDDAGAANIAGDGITVLAAVASAGAADVMLREPVVAS